MSILRVKREEEFAPIKNSDEKGVDCPKTARKLYQDFMKKWENGTGTISQENKT